MSRQNKWQYSSTMTVGVRENRMFWPVLRLTTNQVIAVSDTAAMMVVDGSAA